MTASLLLSSGPLLQNLKISQESLSPLRPWCRNCVWSVPFFPCPSSLRHHSPTLLDFSNLSLGGPDALDETVTLGQAVEGVVGLTHGTDEAAEGVDVVLAGDGTAGLVNLGDGDLDGGVVLGLDDAVGGRALAGDVTVGEEEKRQVESANLKSLFCASRRIKTAAAAVTATFEAHCNQKGALTGPQSRHGRFPF